MHALVAIVCCGGCESAPFIYHVRPLTRKAVCPSFECSPEFDQFITARGLYVLRAYEHRLLASRFSVYYMF